MASWAEGMFEIRQTFDASFTDKNNGKRRSSGSLEFLDSRSVLHFTGTINVVGGGFSSVRKSINPIDLSEYAGIVIDLITTVAHDGATPPLGMHLQLHDRSSRYGFASAFSVPLSEFAGEETSVYLPMSSFDR